MLLVEDWIKESREDRTKHINLDEPCVIRGGNSTVHKGVLAQYLYTNIPHKPKLWIDLCHACHNDKCSNPKHLYWGTRKENIEDSKNNGTWKSCWDKTVDKYGYDKACELNKRNGNNFAKSLKGRPSNNKQGKNQYSK